MGRAEKWRSSFLGVELAVRCERSEHGKSQLSSIKTVRLLRLVGLRKVFNLIFPELALLLGCARITANEAAASLAVAGFQRHQDESCRCKVKQNFGRAKPAIARNRLLGAGRISKVAVDLVKQYCLSHKLKLPDAQIAATALHFNAELFTLNRKDFAYIPNLKLYEQK